MQALEATHVVAWAAGCVRSLDALRDEIDSINVYPVPDSDTGSNLLHTFTGAHGALGESPPAEAGGVLSVLARGAIIAARGNSGVILSQALRGMAEAAGEATVIDGSTLIRGLVRADRLATEAVARPAQGTMLTVLNAAMRAAHEATGTVENRLEAAVTAAARALHGTPSQLEVLAEAGVVDAGGWGVLAVLDELAAVVTGTPARSRPELAERHPLPRAANDGDAGRASGTTSGTRTVSRQPWEVMYLLDGATDRAVRDLRHALSGIGDCVTVAGDGLGSHAVHVHCADIGAAIEAGLQAGKPHDVRVESLTVAERVAVQAGVHRAVVAIVEGAALARLCGQAGAQVLEVAAGEVPSTERVEQLIEQTAAAHITLLPGGSALTRAAEHVATRQSGRASADAPEVVTIPCASPVQVLSALAVHDVGRRAGDDVVAMAEAAAATHRGELSFATHDALTWSGRAHSGDVVGFVDDEVVLIQSSDDRVAVLTDAAMEVLERMLGVGGELVTILLGDRAPEGIDGSVAERLRAAHPEVECVAHQGGQSDTVLTIGVE